MRPRHLIARLIILFISAPALAMSPILKTLFATTHPKSFAYFFKSSVPPSAHYTPTHPQYNRTPTLSPAYNPPLSNPTFTNPSDRAKV